MIIRNDNDLFVIRIFNNYIEDNDIYDIDFICNIFKDFLRKYKDKYDIRGLCCIEVYVNYKHGIVMEIKNIYKYDDELDVKIKFHIDYTFLMEINCDNIDDYEDVYYYKDKYYSLYDDYYDSNIIYRDSLNILNNGIKIK